MITFKEIASKRRELENLLIVLEGFQDKGIKVPKYILNDLLYEPRKVTQTDDNFSKDKPS